MFVIVASFWTILEPFLFPFSLIGPAIASTKQMHCPWVYLLPISPSCSLVPHGNRSFFPLGLASPRFLHDSSYHRTQVTQSWSRIPTFAHYPLAVEYKFASHVLSFSCKQKDTYSFLHLMPHFHDDHGCLAAVFHLFDPAQSRHGFSSSILPLHSLRRGATPKLQGCLLNHYFHPFVLPFLLKHHLSLLQNLASTIESFYFDKGKVLRRGMKSR